MEDYMIVRKLNINDGAKYRKLLYELDRQTSFMLYEAGERKTTIEEIKKRIRNTNLSGGAIFVVENEETGELLGFLAVHRGVLKRINHSGYIVVGLLEKARGKGFGTRLFENANRFAKDNDISKLELTVMVHNHIALGLYKKMGFEIEGIKRKSVIINGQEIDEYYMGKLL
jgi:RimJ/RimL family protein N-acetyltransferase